MISLYLTVIDVIHWINIPDRTVIQVGDSVTDVQFITQCSAPLLTPPVLMIFQMMLKMKMNETPSHPNDDIDADDTFAETQVRRFYHFLKLSFYDTTAPEIYILMYRLKSDFFCSLIILFWHSSSLVFLTILLGA